MTEKVKNHCFGCDKPLYTLKKYCDDNCKSVHYADRRRSSRAYDSAIRSVEKILFNIHSDDISRENRAYATELLIELAGVVQKSIYDGFECADCGHFFTATMPTKCAKCASKRIVNKKALI